MVVELDLTNRCNNRCPACVGRNTVKAELSWEEIERIADGLCELDCKGVILSGGGEPLLHPQFIQALEFLKERGLKIGINTNGLTLDRAKAEAMIKQGSSYAGILRYMLEHNCKLEQEIISWQETRLESFL